MDRFVKFGARGISVACALPKSDIGKHIALQLTRSITSAGANYSEACSGESKRDFVHKMQVVTKELRETVYWLRLIELAKMISAKRLQEILAEGDELIAISVASIKTAKSRK